MKPSKQHQCPHCGTGIDIREIPHRGLFKSARLCPQCGGRFAVDPATKKRQALFFVILSLALVLTILLYRGNGDWLIPALVSYAALALVVVRGNRKLFFVAVNDGPDEPGPP